MRAPRRCARDRASRADEAFWQITAAELLGVMRAPEAVRPLLGVLVDPAKVDADTAALRALVRIGEPSVAPTIALLRSEDAELVASAKAAALGDAPTGARRRQAAHVGVPARKGARRSSSA